jgi:hypothetical protein
MARINEEDYKKYFGLQPENKDKVEKALEHALDIRKFEIELYWKRAAYFWTLIAAAFAGYFAILSAVALQDKEYLAYIVSCIGILFTWAWFLVNRGSKYWQENWENHVDMLEDSVTGPLYKTVLHRPTEEDVFEKYVTGPLAMSPSKTAQWVSLFTLCVWLVLVCHSLPKINFSDSVDVLVTFKHILVGIITITFAVLIARKGRTWKKEYDHVADKRETRIIF